MTGILCALIVIANADGTLAAETVGPEATDVDVGLRDAGVSEQQPGTKDRLGEDVENSVGDDLLVDAQIAAAIGNAPDTNTLVSKAFIERSLLLELT